MPCVRCLVRSLLAGAFLLPWAPVRAEDDSDEHGFDCHVEELTLVELASPEEAGELQITVAGDGASGGAGQALALSVELESGAGLTIAVAEAWVVSSEVAVEQADGARLARFVPAGLAWRGIDDVELGLGVVLHAGDGPLDIGASARFVIEI